MTKLNLYPTVKHLTDIEKWLIEEWNETNRGFYSDWSNIREAFTEKTLSIITKNDFAIGFVTYKIYDFTAVINITEIKPSERKKGLAKKMINETLEFFRSQKVLAVKLFCSPENSESFWQKMGFLNFYDVYNQYRINMYKTLVETLDLSQDENRETTIKLWDCEPYQAKDFEPNWVWKLSFLSDNMTLTKPIIFPVSQDWQIELTGVERKNIPDKIKYSEIDLECDGSFMIIRKINI